MGLKMCEKEKHGYTINIKNLKFIDEFVLKNNVYIVTIVELYK